MSRLTDQIDLITAHADAHQLPDAGLTLTVPTSSAPTIHPRCFGDFVAWAATLAELVILAPLGGQDLVARGDLDSGLLVTVTTGVPAGVRVQPGPVTLERLQWIAEHLPAGVRA